MVIDKRNCAGGLCFDEIGYWSEIKLDIVKEYAQAYSKIFATKRFTFAYIDGFAGSGVHLAKGSKELVPGSPLNALKIDFNDIHWAIVGGESGPKSRPMDKAWVVEIRDQCLAARVPFFFKQWGGTNRKKAGRLLDGRTWDEQPRLAMPTPSISMPVDSRNIMLAINGMVDS